MYRSCREGDDRCVELTCRWIEGWVREEMGVEEVNENVEGFNVEWIPLR